MIEGPNQDKSTVSCVYRRVLHTLKPKQTALVPPWQAIGGETSTAGAPGRSFLAKLHPRARRTSSTKSSCSLLSPGSSSPTRSWRATLLSRKLVKSKKKTARDVADRCMVNHDGPRCRPVRIRGNTKTEAEDYNSDLSTRMKSCSQSLPSTRLKQNRDRVLHHLNMFHLLKAALLLLP